MASYHLVLPLAGDNDSVDGGGLTVQLSDLELLSNSHRCASTGRGSLVGGDRLHGAGGTRQCANLKYVGGSKVSLDKAGVELDNALDRVKVSDADVKRVLDDHEGDALGARGRGQRSRVLEHLRGLDLSGDIGEVNAAGDGDLGAWGADGLHR